MKRVAILDDYELDRELLKLIIKNYFETIKEEYTIYEYSSGDALIVDIEEEFIDVDLLFLDIIMEGINGMDIARRLRDIHFNAPIVFLTASQDYAIESYEVHASGYLLKPIDAHKLTHLLSEIFKTNIQKSIAVKVKRQFYSIDLDNIVYVESDKHVLHIYLNNGERIQTTEKLVDLEKSIKSKKFIRCHQSYLVNMDYIQSVTDHFILKGDIHIPIRARGRKEIINTFEKYQYFKV